MNKKVNHNKIFICKICYKEYASASSLCNHNNKFHSELLKKKSDNSLKKSDNSLKKSDNNFNNQKQYNCRFCNKEYTNKQSRWSHEQKCINKDDIDELKNIINELKQQFASILKEKGRVHHKTLQKINNQVSNTINGNVNNGTIINNTYVKFGDVSYEKIFDEKEILSILNKQYMSLEEGITKIHFNEKLPEYSNVFITNLKDPLSYIFNGKAFITVKKHDMLNELIDTHINEINLSYDKMKNKIIPKHADRIENFLQKLNDIDTKYKDPENDRVYSNYKAYKMDAIKLAIYNGSDKKKLESLKNIKLIEKIDCDSEDSDIEI
jgi:hypothetical protein